MEAYIQDKILQVKLSDEELEQLKSYSRLSTTIYRKCNAVEGEIDCVAVCNRDKE